MDYLITTNENGKLCMSFSVRKNILNNFYLSLSIPKGSWFHNKSFGHNFSVVKTVTEENRNLITSLCIDALQWMLKSGKIKNLSADTVIVRDIASGMSGYSIKIKASDSSDKEIEYETFYRVV